MDLKKLFRIYEDDPDKYGLYELSVNIYNGKEDYFTASVFVSVMLKRDYTCVPDGITHRDFTELLAACQDCIGFNYINGYINSTGIFLKGWL